jgi:hypothetical protein
MAIQPTEHLSINDPSLPSILGFFDYEVYSADSLEEAKAFLEKVSIIEARKYVIVETPDGIVGRDSSGIYRPSRGWRGNDLDEPGRAARIMIDDVKQAKNATEQIAHWWPHFEQAKQVQITPPNPSTKAATPLVRFPLKARPIVQSELPYLLSGKQPPYIKEGQDRIAALNQQLSISPSLSKSERQQFMQQFTEFISAAESSQYYPTLPEGGYDRMFVMCISILEEPVKSGAPPSPEEMIPIKQFYRSFATLRSQLTVEDQDLDKRCRTLAVRYESKKACFVATACFGSPDAEEVVEFRRFRDATLNTSIVGRAFVAFYYQVSPEMAASLERNSILKKLVRLLVLRPILSLIRDT